MVAQDLNAKIEFFSYRTATVGDHFLTLPRELVRNLEEALAEKAGVKRDNHTVYELMYECAFHAPQTTYIWFTGNHAIFGRTIEKRRY